MRGGWDRARAAESGGRALLALPLALCCLRPRAALSDRGRRCSVRALGWLERVALVIRKPADGVRNCVFTASHSATIARSPREVFDLVADAGRQRSWNALVRSMDRESDGPLGVGARWRGDIARVGRVDVELIEYDRPRRVVHLAHPWMADALHVWEVHDLADGCRLLQRGEMRPTRMGWLLAPLMPVIVRRQLRDCALWLRQGLEGDEVRPRP